MLQCKENCKKTIVRSLPDWCDVSKQNRTVCIDVCLLLVVEAFWTAKIETLGNCCGHYGPDPSIILGQNCTVKQIILAKKIAKEVLPNEHLQLMQWQLSIV